MPKFQSLCNLLQNRGLRVSAGQAMEVMVYEGELQISARWETS